MPGKIQVQDVDVKAERRQRLRRRGGLTLAAVGALALAGGAYWYFTPPAMPETLEDARALVDSNRFDRLSKEQKQPYYDVIREKFGSLDPDERRAMLEEDEQLREALRESRMIQFRGMLVQMAEMSPEQRQTLGETFRRGRPQDRGSEERTPEEQAERDQQMRERISDRLANGDSQMNQLMREMFSQMRKQGGNP